MIVFVSGAESTGKTLLSENLAHHFNVGWVPEYAREYVEGLQRAYSFDDVCVIAKKQILQIQESEARKLIIFDTGLIITKVWFEEVYGTCPKWFLNAIHSYASGYYLICLPDIEWIQDGVRENQHKRNKLHQKYVSEIAKLGAPYEIISGSHDDRIRQGIVAIKKWQKHIEQ